MATLKTASPARASTSRGWRWAVPGALLGGAIALVCFAPARWLAAGIAQATGARVQLVNARGTVWNGTAGLVFASGAGGNASVSLPGAVGWALRPAWGAIDATLDLSCCSAQPVRARLHPEAGGVQLDWSDGTSRWPAALLAGFGSPCNSLKPEGTLDLTTQAFALRLQDSKLGVGGRATLDATDISSSLSTLRPMGSYRFAVEGGPVPTLLLTTREGSLQLNGSGSWSGTFMRFSGEASAAPGREDALSNLLNIIGRREGARSIITLD